MSIIPNSLLNTRSKSFLSVIPVIKVLDHLFDQNIINSLKTKNQNNYSLCDTNVLKYPHICNVADFLSR